MVQHRTLLTYMSQACIIMVMVTPLQYESRAQCAMLWPMRTPPPLQCRTTLRGGMDSALSIAQRSCSVADQQSHYAVWPIDNPTM